MATLAIPRRGSATRTLAVSISPALAAGLMVGIAESLFFVFTLLHTPVERALGRGAMGIVDVTAIIVICAAPIAAGAGFAWLVDRQSAWWRVALSGVALLLASIVGVVVAAGLEPLGLSNPGLLVRVFQLAFVLASGIAAVVCSWAVARLLRVDAALKKATLVGLITGLTYLVVAMLLDTLPGWRVGTGDMAMPRVAMLGNLVSGTVGGTLAVRLFLKRP
jgi:hypothetical protein